MIDVKRYDMDYQSKNHGQTINVTANENGTGKWVLATDYDAMQAERDAALALLSAIMKEANVYEPVNDGTRNWCPDLSIYLRGNYGLMVMLTPEEYETLKQLTNPKE